MIQKLQKLFHTDKWWGKVLLVVILYLLFWGVFYIGLFQIFGSMSGTDLGGFLFILYLLIGIPLSSLFIPKIIIKSFKINKTLLYIFHGFIIFSSLLAFLYISLIISARHWFSL